jgi:hypothetical protein
MFAMFPLCPKYRHVPPYPGLAPETFEEWAHPSTCFSDGGLGRWDPRRYPQLWNPRKPWLGYHPNNDNNSYRFSVLDFWYWNDTLNPLAGGHWDRTAIERLFGEREEVEERLHRLAGARSHGVLSSRPYDLPYFDRLDERDTIRWKTFREGRDALGRTIRYVAELGALCTWLWLKLDIISQQQKGMWPPKEPPLSASSNYLGVWAATINSSDDWQEILHNRLPIFMIFSIPPEHPLTTLVRPGNLDADERYRQNHFDASLGRVNARSTIQCYKFPTPHFLLEDLPKYLPSSLKLPSPERSHSASSTVYNGHWTTYICDDSRVTRDYRISTRQQKVREVEREAFTYLHPKETVLDSRRDHHPLFHVIPPIRDFTYTYWEEVWDPMFKVFYPRRTNRLEGDTHDGWTYYFHFPAEMMGIFSNHPFPGRDRRLGRRPTFSSDEDGRADLFVFEGSELGPDKQVRTYCIQKPLVSPSAEETYVWMPGGISQHGREPRCWPDLPRRGYHPYLPTMSEGAAPRVTFERPSRAPRLPESLNPPIPPRSHTPDPASTMLPTSWLPWVPRDALLGPVVRFIKEKSGNPTGMEVEADTEVDALSSLVKQRQLLKDQRSRSLWTPKFNTRIRRLVQWRVPNSNLVCYPIRICNLHGSASCAAIFNVLQDIAQISDIVVFSFYDEVDTTLTLDIGLRYVEDALSMWALLHGVIVDQRPLDVYPIETILGKGQFPVTEYPGHRPPFDRLRLVQRILEREEEFPEPDDDILLVANDLIKRLVRLCMHPDTTTDLSSHLALPKWRFIQTLSSFILDKVTEIHSTTQRPLGRLRLDGWQPLTRVAEELHDSNEGRSDGFNEGLLDNSNLLYVQTNSAIFCDPPKSPAQLIFVTGTSPDCKTGGRKKRSTPRTRVKVDRTGNDLINDPGSAKRMNHAEREQLTRGVAGRINTLIRCYNRIELPQFTVNGGSHVAAFYKKVWDWVEGCEVSVSNLQDTHRGMFDSSPLVAALSDVSRLRRVYGPDYIDCLKAMGDRDEGRLASERNSRLA